MAVIEIADYISVAKSITNSRVLVVDSSGPLYDITETIVLSNDLETEIDLLMSFYQAWQGAISYYDGLHGFLLSAVSSLQNHVITRATDPVTSLPYTDINDWLRDNSITVPDTFASISEVAGWAIDHDRITADPTITITY